MLELAGAQPLSQLELASRIGVTPSVVVDMLDELEILGAIRWVQQAGDRRRRIIELTAAGWKLREQAGHAAHTMDAELLRGIDPDLQAALRTALTQIGSAYGLSYT